MCLVHLSENSMAPHSSTLAWKIHGQRSLVGCSPWGSWGLDTTERLHFHFSLSCIGEGNGNPLQCSCLENPRGGEVWWAAVYGVAQSWTQLKQLSSSSSSIEYTRMNHKVNYGFWVIITYQCRPINYNKHSNLMRDVSNGETVHVWGQKVYDKSLYLPLNFSVNLKLL